MLTRPDINLLAIAIGLAARTATAGFVEFENADAWFTAAGPTTTIDFVLDAPQILTDQYANLGALFADGNDVAHAATAFHLDGWGAKGAPTGGGPIVVVFPIAREAFAAQYLGSVKYSLYLDDTLVYTSSLFSSPAGGAFAGIIASTLFNRVEIFDPLGPTFVDNIYFNAVPVPATVALLAGSLLGGRRRRG
ncbi:MAG: hypothetical protein U0575_13980 [Phycisphaerales bacterium]